MYDELYGLAEHEDFERGAEDMERRALRLEAEAEADNEAAMEEIAEDTLEYEEPEREGQYDGDGDDRFDDYRVDDTYDA